MWNGEGFSMKEEFEKSGFQYSDEWLYSLIVQLQNELAALKAEKTPKVVRAE